MKTLMFEDADISEFYPKAVTFYNYGTTGYYPILINIRIAIRRFLRW